VAQVVTAARVIACCRGAAQWTFGRSWPAPTTICATAYACALFQERSNMLT